MNIGGYSAPDLITPHDSVGYHITSEEEACCKCPFAGLYPLVNQLENWHTSLFSSICFLDFRQPFLLDELICISTPSILYFGFALAMLFWKRIVSQNTVFSIPFTPIQGITHNHIFCLQLPRNIIHQVTHHQMHHMANYTMIQDNSSVEVIPQFHETGFGVIDEAIVKGKHLSHLEIPNSRPGG